MTLILAKLLKKLVTMLHSDISPRQIAAGAAFGMLVGLPPFVWLNVLGLFFIIFLLPVNIGAAILSWGVFKLVAFFVDPASHNIGYFFLVQAQGLAPVWTSLYNAPIVPFTKFYNTVVLGAFVLGIVFFVPVMIAVEKGIVRYRTHWRERVEKWKIMKLFKLTSAYNIWNKYQ